MVPHRVIVCYTHPRSISSTSTGCHGDTVTVSSFPPMGNTDDHTSNPDGYRDRARTASQRLHGRPKAWHPGKVRFNVRREKQKMSQWSSITGRTGKGAFAVRTMMDFMLTDKDIPLRDVQQHVLDVFVNAKDTISLQYVKNLIKELEQRHIWKKSSSGRKWFLALTDRGCEFKEFLEQTEWGLTPNTILTPEDQELKHELFMKWITSCHIVRSTDEREPLDNSELHRLHKVGMLNYVTYNPNTMIAKPHPKNSAVWIIRPLRDGEEPAQ